MINRAIAVINGKGGVGKTSITSNLSGLFALAGHRVLAVDLDPQGNLASDFGVKGTPGDDDGLGMFVAVAAGQTLVPMSGVRDNLDLVCGGAKLREMSGALRSRASGGDSTTAAAVNDALVVLGENYDLMLLDCPPGEHELQRMALTAANYALIPTKTDGASLDGLSAVAELFTAVRGSTNPDITLLGVALFGVGSAARRIARSTRDKVALDLGDPTLLFDTHIRHAESAAVENRDAGKLIHELETGLPAARKAHFDALRHQHGESAPHNAPAPRLITSLGGLASDYEALAREVIDRLTRREQNLG